MGFLSVIRRWALREEMPIREIARRTGLSRNTIKKYLREGAVEPMLSTSLSRLTSFPLMDSRFAGSTAKEARSFAASASAGVIRFNPETAEIIRGKQRGK